MQLVNVKLSKIYGEKIKPKHTISSHCLELKLKNSSVTCTPFTPYSATNNYSRNPFHQLLLARESGGMTMSVAESCLKKLSLLLTERQTDFCPNFKPLSKPLLIHSHNGPKSFFSNPNKHIISLLIHLISFLNPPPPPLS